MRYAAIALAALSLTTGALASEGSVSFDAGIVSTYVWRGLALTDGPAFQPGMTITAGQVSANIWGNQDLDDVNNAEQEYTELDYTFDWTFPVGEKVEVSVGAIQYTFPNTLFGITSEVYVGASFDVPSAPSIKLYRDIEAVGGLYGTIGLGHSFEMPADGSLDIGLTIGFGDEDNNLGYYGADSGLTDLLFSVGYGLKISEKQSVAFSVSYSSLLGDPADVLNTDPYTAVGVAYAIEY